MDYSKLSDQELDNLVNQKKAALNPIDSFANATEEELNNLVNQKIQAGGLPKREKVIQEMPEGVSPIDRAIVKNFANSNTTGVNYLQKKYPDHEVKMEGDQYLMRKRGARDWNTLDPDTGFFSKDFLNDAGDVIFDVGAGTASGIASGAAGAAALPTGVAALPAAAAAGGATNAGLEYLRQKLGNMFGIDQDVSGTDVAAAGAAGAISPLIFGTGASANQLAKGALKRGLDEAGQVALKDAQRGAVGYGYDAVTRNLAPKIGQLVSGIDKGTIKTFANNVDRIKDVEASGITDLATASQDKIVGAIGDEKNRIGKLIGDTIDATGKKVNIAPVKGVFNQLKEKLMSYKDEIDNPLLQEKLKEVLSTYDDLFTKAAKEEVSPLVGLVDEYGRPLIQAGTKKAKEEIGDSISARAAFKLQQDLADLAELSKMKGGMLSRLTGKSNVAQKELAEVSRSGYNLINKGLDEATDGLSSELKSEYKRHGQIQRALAPHFSTPERTYATLKNIGSKNKRILRETLQKIDSELNTNLLDDAKFLDAFNTFSDASTDAIGGAGTTSTSRTIPLSVMGSSLGGLAGYKTGNEVGGSGYGFAGATLGAGLGAFLGAKGGSPAMIRALIEKGLRAEKIGNAIKNTVPVRGAPVSAWNFMRDRK